MTAPDLPPEQRELSEADHDALVDTICLALPQPHRGTCNRVADAVAPTVARMVADARAVGDRQGAARVTAAVEAIHTKSADDGDDDWRPWCTADGRVWPCPTRAALAQAATSEEGSQA